MTTNKRIRLATTREDILFVTQHNNERERERESTATKITCGKSSCAFMGEEEDTAAWNKWGYLSLAQPASIPG